MLEFTEHFLIDDHGRRCDALPEVVEALLDYPDADFNIVDYAMRNLGWIEVHARFRPLTVSFEAASALHGLIAGSSWTTIKFEFDLFGWVTETYEDDRAACSRLAFIVKSVIDFFRHPPYTSVEKSLASLDEEDSPDSKMLASVLDFWQECSGHMPEDLTHKMRQIGILPRLVLVDVISPGSAGRFQYIGSAFTMYGDRWPHEAIGRSFQEQPDKAYATRVAESCKKAIQSAEPWYAHVDACIGMPEKDPRRSRYKCLKTPWRSSRGEQVLMITSVLTPDVDIPLVPSVAQRGH
jgi:hypothetical protein